MLSYMKVIVGSDLNAWILNEIEECSELMLWSSKLHLEKHGDKLM